MGTTVELIVAILLPTAVGCAFIATARGQRWLAELRRTPHEEPVERLRADLCRLHAQLDATETSVDLFGKNLRRNAVRAAYVDALGTACRRFGVPPPAATGTAAVPLTEIYRAEAALREHGLDVRGSQAR